MKISYMLIWNIRIKISWILKFSTALGKAQVKYEDFITSLLFMPASVAGCAPACIFITGEWYGTALYADLLITRLHPKLGFKMCMYVI